MTIHVTVTYEIDMPEGLTDAEIEERVREGGLRGIQIDRSWEKYETQTD